MPSKRTRKSRQRQYDLSDAAWAFLNDEPLPENANVFEIHSLTYGGMPSHRLSRKELWGIYGAEITGRLAVISPGTRPSLWWVYDAPSLLRRRLGGVGIPGQADIKYRPYWRQGVPTRWFTRQDIERHGDILPYLLPGFPKHPFKGVAIDPNNPPTFESQAAYLKRHDLLQPGEMERLTAADFEPARL